MTFESFTHEIRTYNIRIFIIFEHMTREDFLFVHTSFEHVYGVPHSYLSYRLLSTLYM